MIRFLFGEGVRWGVDIRGCAWAWIWAQPLNLPQRHTEPFLLSRLRNVAEASPPFFRESLSLVLFQNTARSTTTRCVAQWHKHILFFIFTGLLFFGASGQNNSTHTSEQQKLPFIMLDWTFWECTGSTGKTAHALSILKRCTEKRWCWETQI